MRIHNKFILLTFIILTNTTQANYTIKIPIEQSVGGSLPNGSIHMKPRSPGLPSENWKPSVPIYGEWINTGEVYGCSNWMPIESTILKDESFNKTATNCNQDQIRTKQNREQEITTLMFRNVGEPTIENSILSTSSIRQSYGTATCSFIADGPNMTFWARVENGTYGQGLTVNGVQIKRTSGYDVSTSFTINGVKYTKGVAKLTYSEGSSYSEVCK